MGKEGEAAMCQHGHGAGGRGGEGAEDRRFRGAKDGGKQVTGEWSVGRGEEEERLVSIRIPLQDSRFVASHGSCQETPVSNVAEVIRRETQ